MKLTTNIRRKFRVSNKAKFVAKKNRYRLSISRSSKNISAQIIDDSKNITLLSASSIEKELFKTPSLFLIDISLIWNFLLLRSGNLISFKADGL